MFDASPAHPHLHGGYVLSRSLRCDAVSWAGGKNGRDLESCFRRRSAGGEVPPPDEADADVAGLIHSFCTYLGATANSPARKKAVRSEVCMQCRRLTST